MLGGVPHLFPQTSPLFGRDPLVWFLGSFCPTAYGVICAILYRVGKLSPAAVTLGGFIMIFICHTGIMVYTDGIFSMAIIWQPFIVQVSVSGEEFLPSLPLSLSLSLSLSRWSPWR